jgi:eukaryotic-like serine/threonine-protein kinase
MSRVLPKNPSPVDEIRVVIPRGAMVAGKYRVNDLLAVGGMGIVFAGMHVELDQRVAIKVVRPELSHSEEAVTRFLNEARAAARLRGQHVARVLDSGRLESGIPYLVMEFLDGADLCTVIRRSGPLPASAAVHYVLQACEAIAEAHSEGIIHRDLKPENLFLIRAPDGSPVVKVLDFGISKRQSPDAKGFTDPTRGIGSPNYMSPEQMVAPDTVDHRSDVWSLGAVLYELLAGHPPFQADTLPAICVKVLREEPIPLKGPRPDVPAGLERVVMRCLSKRREERYSSVAELARELSSFAPDAARALASRAERILARSGRDSGSTPLPLVLPPLYGPRLSEEGSDSMPPKRRRNKSWIFALALTASAVAGAFYWAGGDWRSKSNLGSPDRTPFTPLVPDAGSDGP